MTVSCSDLFKSVIEKSPVKKNERISDVKIRYGLVERHCKKNHSEFNKEKRSSCPICYRKGNQELLHNLAQKNRKSPKNIRDSLKRKEDTQLSTSCSPSPNQTKTCSEEKALTFTETDPNLPEGWKIRTSNRNQLTGRHDKEFLSPELRLFRSRVAVVKYLKVMDGFP